ncbi:MAG: threonine/serine exporter family protein [Clostridia bacterium]|nr:threonine/serine exporter family protein [Clostridia bacterium]MBR4184291.1 threonine/serine exporter family protein [Clostridia bacterium]
MNGTNRITKTAARSEAEEFLDLAVTLGYRLLSEGAEISRVEEAVTRLMQAYGVPGDVFAIPSSLIVTVCPEGSEPVTWLRRIAPHGTDVDGLERTYSLARALCAEVPPVKEAKRRLDEIGKVDLRYPVPVLYLAYFLAASAFAVFFGGTLSDGLLAGVLGVFTGAFLRLLTRLRVNAFFQTMTASFLIAVVSQTLTHFHVIRYADATAIGALMLLVPGMMMTDSMRDIIYGDTLSGINKFVQVVLTAAALLLGTGTALRLSHLLWDVASVGISLDVPYPWWIQVSFAALACCGYCILFNIRIPGMFVCMAGGGLGWAAFLAAERVTASGLFAYFAAAAVISLYAEIMARVRKFPAFSYLVIALLPLVPGAGVYYTVEYLLQGSRMQSVEQGVRTAAAAGLLAVGMLVVSSIFRMVGVARQQRKDRAKNARG